MTRRDMKEIIIQVIKRMAEDEGGETPVTGCIFRDAPDPCDVTSAYGIGEEG